MRLVDIDELKWHFGEVEDDGTRRLDHFITYDEMDKQPIVDAVLAIRRNEGSARMKPIDGEEAIRILQRMIDAREKNCVRSAKIEQGAFRMAIEVIRQLPEIQAKRDSE